MKQISPVDKHLLYWYDKRIVEWIQGIIPEIEIVGTEKTPNRMETLKQISHYTDTCVVDCDIIPFGIETIPFTDNTLLCFCSDKNKYGSVIVDTGKVMDVQENENTSRFKCSGVYFVQSVADTINKMKNPNSIGSAMIGADAMLEKTFKRMGDIEDYFEAL